MPHQNLDYHSNPPVGPAAIEAHLNVHKLIIGKPIYNLFDYICRFNKTHIQLLGDSMNKLTEENSIKLYILYLMDKINHPISYSDIQDAVSYGEFVGYFDFERIFSLLEKENNIKGEKDIQPPVFCLTLRGRQIVENLSHLLDYEVRDKGLKAAMKFLQFKKTGANVTVTSKPDDKGYRLSISINEKSLSKMELSVYVDDKQMADNMQFTAEQRPEVIYRGIIALLTGDVNFLPL